ncbi:hypothetical protein ACFQ08_09995 [Streptosporangium algeriense]|uniref:Cupin domain-containing protein n=1 Tax=Streptosporangium algeriense TaxID=1682748 RepID=A0ABW3DM80_9ACTN
MIDMKQQTLIPGLTVTEAMYETAAAGLATYAPELPALTWETFTDPAGWALVPHEETGLPYKAELTVREHPAGTLRRVNVWYGPDRRGGARPQPHSHPWPFEARILTGGYAEDRYALADDQVNATLGVIHASGATNDIPRDLYHEVVDVEPGTLTLMVATARGVRGGWGYLCVDSGTVTPALAPTPGFLAALRDLNPHRPA